LAAWEASLWLKKFAMIGSFPRKCRGRLFAFPRPAGPAAGLQILMQFCNHF
jgi:hypothetical protein